MALPKLRLWEYVAFSPIIPYTLFLKQLNNLIDSSKELSTRSISAQKMKINLQSSL